MGSNSSKINVRYVKNMLGDDIPAHTIIRVGDLTAEDWDASMDPETDVLVPRGELLTTVKRLRVVLGALSWLMYKSNLSVYEYLPEYDEEVEENISIIMDHTVDADPVWRFRVFVNGEEDDSVSDDDRTVTADGADSGY